MNSLPTNPAKGSVNRRNMDGGLRPIPMNSLPTNRAQVSSWAGVGDSPNCHPTATLHEVSVTWSMSWRQPSLVEEKTDKNRL